MLNFKRNKYLYLSIFLFFIYILVIYFDKDDFSHIEYDNNTKDENLIINQNSNLNNDDSIMNSEIEINKNITYSEIEKININNKEIEQKVINVGLNGKGEIYVLDGPEHIVWYEKTGEDVQNIIIAGHRTWGSKKGIFYDSEKWDKGTKIEVLFKNGEIETFELKERYIYTPELTPESIMAVNEGKYRITLITCSTDGKERIYNIFYLN